MSARLSREKYLLIAINLFWFLVIFFLTHITPVADDDVLATFVTGTNRPIQNVHDFFLSIWIHQMNWSGNLVGKVIAQTFSLMPRIVFELCNGLVWVGTANLICRFARDGLKLTEQDGPIALSLIYLSMWFFIPGLRDSFWLCGSIEYLWFNTLALLFGYLLICGPAVLRRRDLTPRRRVALSAAMFLFGFAVSTCVRQSTGCVIPAAMGLGAIWAFYRKKEFDIPVFAAAFLGIVIGFCVSTLSPGNIARIAYVAEQSPYTASLLFRIARTAYYGLRHTLVPLAITLFFVVLNRARHSIWQLDELFFILLAFINIAVMAIPNGYSQRTVLFSDTLLIIAGARSAVRYFSSGQSGSGAWLKRALWVLIVTLTAFALLEFATCVMLHFTQGTAPDRQTIYFAQYFELFG